MTDFQINANSPTTSDLLRQAQRATAHASCGRPIVRIAPQPERIEQMRQASRQPSGRADQAEFYVWAGVAMCLFATLSVMIVLVLLP